MKTSQIAAQLYTCRDLLQTPADIARTLHRLRQAGYEAVQVSGMGPIPEEELVRILAGEGLVCCATHESSAVIRENPQAVVERLAKLGCRYTAYPFPQGVDMGDRASVMQLAADLDRAGAVLRAAGQVLCYHNHQHEFRKMDGRTVLELILDATRPENLQGEIDTYWVQFGGGDSAAWCERLAGRLPLIHLKDYMIDAENKPVYCEIGAGNLDFPGIVAAAEKSGCEWFIIEQDTCPGDPVDSLATSLGWLRENVCGS